MINILCYVIIIFCIFIFAIASLILLPIGYFLRGINKKLSYKYARVIANFIMNLIKILSFTKVDVKYDENIDNRKNHFYISNHRGVFDVILTFPMIKEDCIIISKKSLKKIPLFSNWMELIKCYFLDRENIRDGFKMVLYCIDQINNGYSIYIFPEGTRSKGENYKDLLDFKEGCFSIPKKTNISVIPIGIYDSREIFEKDSMVKVGKNIHIHFGKTYTVTDDVNYEFKNIVKELL